VRQSDGFAQARITRLYLGGNRQSPVVYSTGLEATGGYGTDIAGWDLDLAGGRGTGSALGGSVAIQVAPPGASGSVLNTLQNIAQFGLAGGALALSFFGAAAVVKQGPLTARDLNTPNSGDVTTDAIISNNNTRIAEIEMALQAYGLLL